MAAPFSRFFHLIPWVFLAGAILIGLTLSIHVQVDLDDDDRGVVNKVFSYKVLDQRNRTIFVGADVAVFADGAWCLSQASSLYESSQISGAVLGLGRYRGFRFTWTCPTGTSVAALVKNFESKRAVLMELEWPEGADNTTQHYDDEN